MWKKTEETQDFNPQTEEALTSKQAQEEDQIVVAPRPLPGMRQSRLFLPILAILSLAVPGPSLQGWGFESHKVINREAAKLLPDEIGDYFMQNIVFIADHAIDPDLWRNDPENHPNEGPGHYIDADLYDAYPFTNIPRSWDALVSEFGDKVTQWGVAPWRIDQFYNRLVREFRSGRWEDAKLTAAALGHYVSDIHMPLHVVENYNGQLSGNRGVHGRWEEDMVNTYLLTDVHPKGPMASVDDPVELAFKIVRESYSYHKALLRADSVARREISLEERSRIADWGVSMEGTKYVEVLFRETGGIARERMEAAAVRIASLWYSAWVESGQPTPPRK